MTMTRKQFLRSIASAGIGVAGGVALAACGDDGTAATPDAPPAQRNCLDNGTAITFSADHGHMLTIPATDIMAGTEKMYTITGGGHTHTVVITAALFTMLQANMSVMAASSTDGAHSHQVMVNCAF